MAPAIAITNSTAVTGNYSADNTWRVTVQDGSDISTSGGTAGSLAGNVFTPSTVNYYVNDALIGHRLLLNTTWYSITASHGAGNPGDTSATITVSGSPSYTTGQTWAVGGKPIDGEINLINHAVTQDVDAIMGRSGSASSTGMYIDNLNSGHTGSFTINSGIHLTAKGNILTANGTLTMSAGSHLTVDSSSATGTPMYNILYYNYYTNTAGLVCNGTSGSHVTIDSNPSGGVGRIFNYNGGSRNVDCTYTDFVLIGNGATNNTNRSIECGCSSAGQKFKLVNCTFDQCGQIYLDALGAANDFIVTGNRVLSGYTNNITLSNSFALFGASALAATSGARTCYDNIFASPTVNMTTVFSPGTSAAWDIKRNVFNNVLASTKQGNLGFDGNLVYSRHGYSPYNWSFVGNGNDQVLNTYVCLDVIGTDTLAFGMMNMNGPTLNGITMFSGLIHDPSNRQINIAHTANSTAPTMTTVQWNNVIGLPMANGVGGGSLFIRDRTHANAQMNNCTLAVGSHNNDKTDASVYADTAGNSGEGVYCKNILTWSKVYVSGYSSFIIGSDNNGYTADSFTTSGIHNNAAYNLNTGTVLDQSGANGVSKLGYGGALFKQSNNTNIGLNDINLGQGTNEMTQGPQFVDSTRNIALFDTAVNGLNNTVATSWVDSHSYAVGDICSAQSAGFYNNAVINFRCVTAHTSASANATNGQPGGTTATSYRTNWEFASLCRIMGGVVSGVVTSPNTSLIATLNNWVASGYIVQNSSLATAADDGGVIGACVYQSPIKEMSIRLFTIPGDGLFQSFLLHEPFVFSSEITPSGIINPFILQKSLVVDGIKIIATVASSGTNIITFSGPTGYIPSSGDIGNRFFVPGVDVDVNHLALTNVGIYTVTGIDINNKQWIFDKSVGTTGYTIRGFKPELFNTTYNLPVGGTTRYVHNSGGNNVSPHYASQDALQLAINNAVLNDVIIVDVDYVWDNALNSSQPICLKSKAGSGWIYIISAGLDNLPEGKRVTPSDAQYMPKIKCNTRTGNPNPAIVAISTETPSAAHNYRLCGIELIDPDRLGNTDLVADTGHTVNYKVSSASHNFVAADAGLTLGISLPTPVGWTAPDTNYGSYYTISSVSATGVSPNYAVLNRAAAVNGATGGTWKIGGQSPGQLVNLGATIVLADGGETGLYYKKTNSGIQGNDRMPSGIWFDRCYMHSDSNYPFYSPVGVVLEGTYMAVIDSYIKGIHGSDPGYCITYFQGNGPYKIKNNYLEATTCNIMTGATDPNVNLTDNVPSDMEIVGNYFTKDSGNWGSAFMMFNLIEVKNGQRLLIEGNYLEKSYRSDLNHNGTMIELTPRGINKFGPGTGDVTGAPWSRTWDVAIVNNKFRSGGCVITMQSTDCYGYCRGNDLVAASDHTTSFKVSSTGYVFHTGVPTVSAPGGGDECRWIEIDDGTGWSHNYARILSVNTSPNYAVLDRVVATNSATSGVWRQCQPTHRILVYNNAADDISNVYSAVGNAGISIAEALDIPFVDVAIDHNIIIPQGDIGSPIVTRYAATDTLATKYLICTNNIFPFGSSGGFYGNSPSKYGKAALDFMSASYVLNKNIFYMRSLTDINYSLFFNAFDTTSPWNATSGGGDAGAAKYTDNPAHWNNWGPHEISGVRFSAFTAETDSYNNRNYALASDSIYHTTYHGTDGLDPGPDWVALNAATIGNPYPLDGSLMTYFGHFTITITW